MKKLLPIALLLPSPIFSQSVPINIPIQNPSFEKVSNPLSPETCGTHFPGIDGWTLSDGNASGYQIANQNPCGISLPPDGKIVALSTNGSTIKQTIQIPTMPIGIYTLSVYVANFFYWYPGEYTVSLSMDSFFEAPLCSISGHALGDFVQIPLSCPVRDQSATNLTISLSGTRGWIILFDKVSLAFTPTN